MPGGRAATSSRCAEVFAVSPINASGPRSSRAEHRGIRLAEVHPVHPGTATTGLDGRIEAIVHNEPRATVDGRGQGEELHDGLLVRRLLVAQLHDADAAGDGLSHGRDHPACAAQRPIGDEVQGQVDGHRASSSTRARARRSAGVTADRASSSATAKLPGPREISAACSAATV